MGKFLRNSLNSVKELPEEIEKAMIIAKAEELGLVKDTSEEVTDIDKWKKRWK